MIDYTPEARRHVRELIAHYRWKNRPEAIQNLDAALTLAETAIEDGTAVYRLYPATYEELVRAGRLWLKAGRYWIAYRADRKVIIGVFWDQAEIDRRYVEARRAPGRS